MLKWMSGKLVIYNFRRDLRFAEENLGNQQVRELCRFLLRHIFAVKAASQRDHEVGFTVSMEVLASLRGLPSHWLQRTQPETVPNALLEHWLTAKSAVVTGALDQKIFQRIDDEIWSFAKGRLRPQEIETIYTETSARQAPPLPHSATSAIQELIADYAVMAGHDGEVKPVAEPDEVARG